MVFLEISQNSQENTCARVSFLIKLQVAPAILLKKRLWHWCFSMNFAKFLRTPFSQNTPGRLLLERESVTYDNIESNQKSGFTLSLERTISVKHQGWHCVKSVCIRGFSGPYFPAFGLNMERYEGSLRN